MSKEMKRKAEEVKKKHDEAAKHHENIEDEAVEAEEVTEESLESKIDKIEAEVEEWKQSYLRKQAEFQNFTKRKENELAELRKYAAEKVILKVLEAVDNLERGMAASALTKDFDSLVKGVEMTLTQMHGIMNAEGVVPITADKGTDYDPYIHQAVMTEATDEVEDNQIIMELQKGYKMKERVIRPSMVKVCKK